VIEPLPNMPRALDLIPSIRKKKKKERERKKRKKLLY
jgi:hypothetical protein